MPAKTIHPIGDQSGGVNTFSNERDIDDRQYSLGYNVDSSIPGEIRCIGAWSAFFDDGNATQLGFSSITYSGSSNVNDMSIESDISAYTGPIGTYTYYIECTDDTVNANRFRWRRYGGPWTPEQGDLAMPTGEATHTLEYGIEIQFVANTGHTEDDSWLFTVSISIFDDVKTGHGIFPFQTDYDHTGAVSESYYLAVAKTVPNNSTDLKICMYHEPTISNNNVAADVINLGNVLHADATVDFIWVDGALRMFDASRTTYDFNFTPKKWWFLETGTTYFKGCATNDLATSNSWQTTETLIASPTGGKVVKTNKIRPLKFSDAGLRAWSSASGMRSALDILTPSDHNVGLLILTDDDSNGAIAEDVGWGITDSSTANYYFYYSYIYHNTQESMLFKYADKVELGDDDNKFCTFIMAISPDDDADDWDNRITGVRLYYNRTSDGDDIKYFIGEFPITSATSGGDNVCGYLDECNPTDTASNLVCMLVGDESGFPVGYDPTDANATLDYRDIGILAKTPPVIFTHAVMSGISSDATSIDCNYKTATMINRRMYVGNIKQKTEESGNVERKYPDRIVKSLPNRFDVLPDTEYIDVAIRDGEEIIKLESFGSRLLQFKQNTLYTIAVAGGEEYLDGTYRNMGITHPNAVTKTEFGIFWVNDKGAYLYNGEKAPVNLIDGKIGLKEWNDWITKDAITGYIPKEKKFIVINDSSDVWETTEETDVIDMYIFNVLTQSWNQGVDSVGFSTSAGTDLDAVSNIVNYIDADKDVNTILFVGNDNLHQYKTVDDIYANTFSTRVFNLTTKDIHAGAPHVRKKFYKAYITYKGLLSASGGFPSGTAIPTVKAVITGADGKSTVTLVGGTTFATASPDDWRTAEYRIDNTSTSDKTASRNAYSVKLIISGDDVYQNFKINDISLVFRPKSVK